MKKYTVELVKKLCLEVEASTAAEATEQALAISELSLKDFEVRCVVDEDAQEEVMTCEVCSGDILPWDKYSTSEEDGYSVCEKCTKESQENER